MTKTPIPRFVQSMQAALAFWQEKTLRMDETAVVFLDGERQNFMQAIESCLTLPQLWEGTTTVVLQSFHFVERRGYWQEWIAILGRLLRSCSDEHLGLCVKLWNRLGQLYRLNSQLSKAIVCHEQAETIASRLEDIRLLAETYFNLGEAYLRQRNHDEAERYGQMSLTRLAMLEDVGYLKAGTLNTLGEVACIRGDLDISEDRLSRVIKIRRHLGQQVPLARAFNNLAITLQAAGKFEMAMNSLNEAIHILDQTSYVLDKAMVQINLGMLYFRCKQFDKAESALRRVNLNYLDQVGHLPYQASMLQNLGNALLMQDRFAEAKPCLRRAISLWRRIDDGLELANSLETLGEVFVGEGDSKAGMRLYEEAIELLEQVPNNARAGKLLKMFQGNLQEIKQGGMH